MDSLRVRLTESRSPGKVRRSAFFDQSEIWWEIEAPEPVLPEPLERHDVAATALIFKAMESARDLHIEGPVSRSLLAGLEELVVSWVLWRPDLYAPIRLSADIELDDAGSTRHADTAIATCSGGVDSSFTIWRHFNARASRGSRKLGAALFVHGLDIPLARHAQFEDAFTSAAETLRSIDLPLVKMRTNWREQASRVWQMDFGSGLSSCLRQWQGTFDSALIGSGEDYAHLVFPWGSNPITFAMLSSPDFEILWDGGGFGRTAKLEAISNWPEALNNLRVCWQNTSESANCGRCEKCVRTKLNFRTLGLSLPPSLGGEPTLAQIAALRASNAVKVTQLQDIVEHCRRGGTLPGWARAVQLSIAWNSALNAAKQTKKVLFPRRRPAKQGTPIATGIAVAEPPLAPVEEPGARLSGEVEHLALGAGRPTADHP
ncbi:hypothetical protein [Sphingomonas sp. LaA6.9]|uniref:hypothetical protein n=1 Tax=Sphingomonas sp. LaA6.9 TaxID=2919914 RepID=UPI001F4F6564|nr:hypothetical protein [Sphingomonas sp. LaA6.9]MCJ8156936.1 hypothetical protein [Sphingomonas sp. LaA6.9]